MQTVHHLMQSALADKVFPGAVLLVSHEGEIRLFEAYGYANLFSKSRMTRETIFDLASLTKPLATTPAIMQLIQTHKLRLDHYVADILPAFNQPAKRKIQIHHLLNHNSGLPDYRAYYKSLDQTTPRQRRQGLRDCLAAEPLVYPVGQKVLYSDLGFMVLAWIIETISQSDLNRFVNEKIYRPLGLNNIFFIELQKKGPQRTFAATERCPWRGMVVAGRVHDENAYAVGGVEGHAGLFGDAGSVQRLLSGFLNTYHGTTPQSIFETRLVRQFITRRPGTMRTLGFDMPAPVDSSSGRYFSAKSVGHLGFTGTSFWMDLQRAIIVVLLTNRVHPTRNNEKIRSLRPIVHDAVMQHI